MVDKPVLENLVRTPTGRLARVVGPGPFGRIKLVYVRWEHGVLVDDGEVCLAVELVTKDGDRKGA